MVLSNQWGVLVYDQIARTTVNSQKESVSCICCHVLIPEYDPSNYTYFSRMFSTYLLWSDSFSLFGHWSEGGTVKFGFF